MKKIYLLLLFLIVVATQAQVRNYTKKSSSTTPAQYTSNRVAKTKGSSGKNGNAEQYVILGGLQYSTEKGDNLSYNTARSGFAVGIGILGNSNKPFSLELDVLYATMGAEFEGFKDDLTYAQMPILFNYSLNKSGFKIGIGPQIGILTGAKINGEDYDYEESLRGFDAGVVLNGAIPFSSKIGMNVRYYYGLTNINKYTDGEFSVYNRAFYAGLYVKI